jgi:hypothetical protein
VHLHPHCQVLGEMAVRGVFIGVGHHDHRAEARETPGRDAVLGQGVAPVGLSRPVPGPLRGSPGARENPPRSGQLVSPKYWSVKMITGV